MLTLLVAVGTFAGIYIGVIPGLSGTMAVSLLVSLTFGWEMRPALALMIGIYVGTVFGGSRSAILLNIPGKPAAVATGIDGYPLAKKGRAGEAMGIATVQSFFGTVIGVAALTACAPLVARLALRFRSVDYLMLALMGLMMIGSLSTKNIKRGLISASIGLFLGCIGIDPQTAVKRFTFDIVYLNSGIDTVVAMVGLFGVGEALFQLADADGERNRQKADRIIPSWKTLLGFLPLTLRSALIGVLVGALPGAGGDIAALLAYDQARRTVRANEVPFGEGAIEGVIAPETANNAAVGGAFIPMLTLGIPGDTVTTVIVSAMSVQGLTPGPQFISNSPDLFYLIVACLALAGIFLLAFGLSGIKLFTRITEIPKGLLMPLILALSTVGVYAIRYSVNDVLWMIGFGVLGFFFKRYDYPIAPMVLGMILRELFENNFRRGVMLNGNSVPRMFLSMFRSPVSVALLVLIVLLAGSSVRLRVLKKREEDER